MNTGIAEQNTVDDMFETIKNKVEIFKASVKVKNISTISCQCDVHFPKNAIRNMNKKRLDDVHGFSVSTIEKFSWECHQTGQKQKGCLYGKTTPSNINPL